MVEQLAQLLAQFLAEHFHLETQAWTIWLVIAIRVGIVGGVFLPAISLLAMFSIWWERKVAGHIQSRLGPMHVGGWHGWSQSIADGVKLILKEDLIPSGADPFLFRLAPYLAFAPVFAAFLALPFGPQFVFEAGLNIGVLYLLAVLSVEVMGTILAGWGSNSKWSVYGAMREACQMVSYEIPLGISIICGVLIAGTLNLTELAYLQGGGIHDWFIYHNPFIFATFLIYFIASLASNKRAPFDLPESESELVAGFHTEYSGLRFSFFFFAEYAAMFVIGGIQAALFLGSWNSPFGGFTLLDKFPNAGIDPIYMLLGYDPVIAGQAYMNGTVTGGIEQASAAMGLAPAGLIAINLYGAFWFIAKAMGIVFVQMWLRWTLPRIRIDQVLYTCVKVLLPASLIALLGNAVWVLLVPQPEAFDAVGNPVPLELTHWAHLLGDTPMLQLITQIVLTALGVAGLLGCLGIVVAAFLQRDTQPRQSLFNDIMPVGNQISFTPGTAKEAAGKSAAAETV